MLRNFIVDWARAGADDSSVAAPAHALEFLLFCQETRRQVVHVESSAVGPYFADLLPVQILAAAETVFIGRSTVDLENARSIGFVTIALAPDAATRKALVHLPIDLIVADLAVLQELLQEPPPDDEILIEDLALLVRVGVPEAERAQPQRLVFSLRLQPRHAFAALGDNLDRTVDYAAVCAVIGDFVQDRADHLIETLADALATHLLARFALRRVELEVRKFVLPETKYVAVRVHRSAAIGG